MKSNLDQKCFECSIHVTDIPEARDKKKAKDLLNLINKSLGVLEENGVFAFFVYLKSEDKKERRIEKNVIGLLNCVFNKELDGTLGKTKLLADEINDLLLAKSLIEKTLIYARYQAKAMSD